MNLKKASKLLLLLLCSLSSYASNNDTTSVQQFDSLAINDTLDAKIADSIENINLAMDMFDYHLDSLVHEFFVDNTAKIDCMIDSTDVVFYPDSVYISRLQQLPYYMEMPFNSIVKSYIEMYAKRRKQVGNMLAIGEAYYFPMFEQALERYGLPSELKYLPVIESGLNALAISPMGAAGLWQFMPSTGKIYGLEINSMVDDRRDPMKSTDAAARFMADLYKLYGDWHLVIAAYNCGPGNVAKAIRRAGGKRGYWEIYPYLPRETRGYVPTFIAANYIMNYYKEHNICPADARVEGMTDTIMIKDRVHLKQIADNVGVTLDELRFLNPQYRHDIVPGEYKQYPLVLPLNLINTYDNNRDTILAYMPELAKRQEKVNPSGYEYYGNGKLIYYKVKDGDYLGKIANKFHVKVSQIQKWNNLRGTFLRSGQRLKIYK